MGKKNAEVEVETVEAAPKGCKAKRLARRTKREAKKTVKGAKREAKRLVKDAKTKARGLRERAKELRKSA